VQFREGNFDEWARVVKILLRALVGRLIYLCFTKPDLAYSVHVLSQLQNSRIEHWYATLRVVRYLKGHPGLGILLPWQNDLQLCGWCDFDWASCPFTRKSLTGWSIQLGTSPISWKTQTINTVSAFSVEVEYRSMARSIRKLKWIKDILLLSSLHVSHPAPICLHCDNQTALHIAKNHIFYECTKHIKVDFYFVRDEIVHNHSYRLMFLLISN